MSDRRLRKRPSVRGIIASHAGIFGIGWIGVIFFGLSGYLITGSMPGGIDLLPAISCAVAPRLDQQRFFRYHGWRAIAVMANWHRGSKR
jgi:hypothetical protein